MPPTPKKKINVNPVIECRFQDDGFVSRVGGLPSFSRSSKATRINEDGKIEMVENNIPRIQYDFEEKGKRLGLLVEPSSQNALGDVTGESWYSEGISNVGQTESPSLTNPLSTVRQSSGGDGAFFLGYVEAGLQIQFVMSMYVKCISGCESGNIFDISSYGVEPGQDPGLEVSKFTLPCSELNRDGKWHRYHIPIFNRYWIDIKLMRGLDAGSRFAIYGLQLEYFRRTPTSLIEYGSIRQADVLSHQADSYQTSEGSFMVGFIPIDDVSTRDAIYPIRNNVNLSFPEIQIRRESLFSTRVVSDTSWIVNGATNAVACLHSGTWTHAISGATWIWETTGGIGTPPGTKTFTKIVNIPDEAISATIQIAADDHCWLYINNQFILKRTSAWATVQTINDIWEHLKRGDNEIKIIVQNTNSWAGLLFGMDISCATDPND